MDWSSAEALRVVLLRAAGVRGLQAPLNVSVLAGLSAHQQFFQETVAPGAPDQHFSIHCHYLSWHDNIAAVRLGRTTGEKLCLQSSAKPSCWSCSASRPRAAGRGTPQPRSHCPSWGWCIIMLLSPQVLLMKKNDCSHSS